jgi:hypothetical protein
MMYRDLENYNEVAELRLLLALARSAMGSAIEELAEARKDTARLDWLLRKNHHVSRCADGWVAFHFSSPVGDPADTPRAAVDSAMAADPKVSA